jgi:hypothetical protein
MTFRVMSLNPQQLQEMSELLIQQFPDDGKELDRVVKYNLGSGLFVDWADHGKFRDVVYQLLDRTERKGATVKLFEGVLRVRPDIPDVRAIIARNLPGALSDVPQTAKQVADATVGLNVVRARLRIAAVHDLIVTSRNDLERLASDIDLLQRYKTLHDCLHVLQIKFLRLVAKAARDLDKDPSASEALMVYIDQLETLTVNALVAAQGLPDSPGERDRHLNWLADLKTIINGLHAAVLKYDSHAAVGLVYQLKCIVRGQPTHLDELIVSTARRTPIDRLVETLKKVAEASDDQDVSSRDLTDAIVALQSIIPDQLGAVAQHSEWQMVAVTLWQAEDLLHQGTAEALEGFQYAWQYLARKVREITASEPAAPWAKDIDGSMANFETAFPIPATPPVSDAARLRFNDFLSKSTKRFYAVDLALHNHCKEIVKLGQPLQRLLQEASNDSQRHA